MSYSVIRRVFIALVVLLLGVASSVKSASLPPSARAFFQQYCFECHDGETQKGKVQLDNLVPDFASAPVGETWGKVFKQLDQREMPPPKKPQPSDEERAAILEWLSSELRTATVTRQVTEGRVALRRVNRVEYQNTLHDLLGIDLNLVDLLPEDGTAHGFDKVSSALTLSPVQMEKYLEAADVALDAVLEYGPRPKLFQERYSGKDVVDRWDARSFRRQENSDVAVLFNSAVSPTEVKKFRAPEPGHYRVRVSASGFQTAGSSMKFRVYAGNFFSGGKTKLLGYFEVPADKPTVVEFMARLDDRRDTLKIVPYGSVPWRNDPLSYAGPGLAVQWIEVEGPQEAKNWPPANSRELLGGADLKTGSFADAEKVLRKFVPRAFRRPTSEADLAPYLKLVRERMERGASLGEALRVGLKAVLVSPRFLMLEEKPGPLDDYALASRLSYFLWNTTPDAALFEAAEKGELSKPDKLRTQVERMLKHPKARGFTEDFTGQWLGLRNIDFTTPDAKLYPEFDELLQISMVQETHAFFDELLRNDLSLLNFVESDFAMLNERLASHYGIPDVTGLDIRKVPLPTNSHRGGVMTHGSVLKVSANGTTTSPVLRGTWVLERVIGKSVPPPPPNVPSAEPDIRGAISIRDQLAKHRSEPTCAGCHARFDPIGFALENYDVIGGWRERYRISPPKGLRVNHTMSTLVVDQRPHRIALGKTVEAADTLPDGRSFTNLEGLKHILLSEPDQIARGLTEKLLIYATGHGLEFTDQPVVRDIVQKVKRKNYGFRTLIHEVIASETFQTK